MRAWLAAGLLVLSGCARAPIRTAEPGRGVLLEVPFFPDSTDQCGPSTLASVLRFWGDSAEPRRLKEEIYEDRLKGSLSLDLLLAARSRGMSAEMLEGSLDRVKNELDAGHPMIAFLDVGLGPYHIGHYVVITGYDEGRQGVYAHSAAERNAFLPYRRFDKQWRKNDRWALLILPPASAEAWIAEGNRAFESGDLAEAERRFLRALDASPGHAGAANNLAMVYLARDHRLADAERLVEDALRRESPLKPYILDTLANVYLRQRRFEEARGAAERAGEAAPAGDPSFRARLLETKRRIAEAAQ